MNRKMVTVLTSTLLAFVSLNAAPQPILAQGKDEVAKNIAVVRKFYDEFSKGNTKVILDVHPPTLKMHYAADVEDVKTQLLYDDLSALKKANPDLKAVIHDIFGAGDIVVANITWTTTHTGDYFGIPATGKSAMHNGIVVRRLKDGKIVESWELFDDLAFMQSIGYLASWDDIVAQGLMSNATPTAVASNASNDVLASSAQDLAGNWQVFKKGTTYFFTFKDDGRFAYLNGPTLAEAAMQASGKFRFDGAQLKVSSVDCSEDGIYEVKIKKVSETQTRLVFKKISDSCAGRADGFSGQWQKIVK